MLIEFSNKFTVSLMLKSTWIFKTSRWILECSSFGPVDKNCQNCTKCIKITEY